MNKASTYSYKGMNQDMAKSAFPKEFYFEGRNIRIVATDSQTTGMVANEKGNKLIYQIPIPVIDYGNKFISYAGKTLNYTTEEIDDMVLLDVTQPGIQYIIGHTTTRRYVVLFTSDENGFDCIWKIDLQSDNYDLTLLYLRGMLFSRQHPIQALNNFENRIVDKVYWVDGLHQMRFINIEHSTENEDLEELIDVPLATIDMVGKYDLSQPVVSKIVAGGIHTAGMIQYAYNLYRINSSQTRLSPLSQLISLDKDSLGGGALNEVVGQTPIVEITNIDENYTHIKVYAIKYTSYNQTPTISLIEDREIPSINNIEVFDDGSVIASVTLEEFLFLGSDIIVPKHINSKDNRLFFANYEERNFDTHIDTRAYSFDSDGKCLIYDNVQLYDGQSTPNIDGLTGQELEVFYDDFKPDADYKFDSINLDYDKYKYKPDGITFGGEGEYIDYELTQTTEFNTDARYFKDEEIYRLGIEFINGFGQYSFPKWVADFKTREGNLSGNYNILTFNLKLSFYEWLFNTVFETEYDKPVGYRVLIAERTSDDKTIVANGLISPMMINDKSDKIVNIPADIQYVKDKSDLIPKLPNFLLRNVGPTPFPFQRYYGQNTRPLQFAQNFQKMQANLFEVPAEDSEIQAAQEADDIAGKFYQYNTMYQLYSPEIIFGAAVQLGAGMNFRVKGGVVNKYNAVWGRTTRSNTQIPDEGKGYDGLSLNYNDVLIGIAGDPASTTNGGLICHPRAPEADHAPFLTWYRGYGDVSINDSLADVIDLPKYFELSSTLTTHEIYGSPELTFTGQNVVNYNGDTKFKYINTFLDIRTDLDKHTFDNDGQYNRGIISGYCDNNKCITFVLGPDDINFTTFERPTIESLYAEGDYTIENIALIGEIVKSKEQIYLGNIYGGNSWEDKRRTKYIEIGDYKSFENVVLAPYVILSPGDTYVNYFKFLRIIPKQPTVYNEGVATWQEIIEFKTESIIDMKNRNDLSRDTWDSKFHYLDEDYHKYNKVYSQQNNLIKQTNLDFNVKKINSFDTSIITTKQKSAGELIDSWTDILQNEVLTLDGKYGAINSFPSFNDELYAIQDKSFAFLSINPRVQVQGSDGLAIELGTGQVLSDYKYISTDSGTLNKWGVVSSTQGVYYYDALNSSFNLFRGNVAGLSDTKGLHTFFVNNVSLNDVKTDNPLIHKGITSGYDYVNNDALFTFYQDTKPNFTFAFNELSGTFTSFYDYLPTMYISKGLFFIAVHPDDTKLYRQFAGSYNEYFDVKYKSSIIFNISPEPYFDCVFDNINFKSEVYVDGIDQPDKTITHIQAFNDYQDSGLVPLIVGRNNNLRRKFRDWNAIVPREGRNRIRAPWIKLKVEFDTTYNNPNNLDYKFILHNLNIYYTI